MTETGDEIVVYYSINLAVHVDLVNSSVLRVVELREEIHERLDDPPVCITGGFMQPCEPPVAKGARDIAENAPWPGKWEFGY